jgi:Putative MetA-pathway of phenol degradation
MKHRQFRRAGISIAFGVALLAAGPRPAHAVDVDPGEYEAAPPGTSFLIGYGIFDWYDRFVDRSGHSVSDSHLQTQTGILRPVHFVDIFGITADPQFFITYGWQDNAKLDGTDLEDASGFYDVILASTFWLLNDQEKKRWFAITPFLWLPVGNYNHKQVLNMGENRWKGALQLGFIQHFAERWAIDVYGDVTFYGDNDSFGRDKSTLKQDPSYQTQAWLRYYITPAWNVAPGYSGTYGGKVSVGGNGDNPARNLLSTETQQLRLATQYFFTPDLQFEAQARTDVWSEGGFRNYLGLHFRILKVF